MNPCRIITQDGQDANEVLASMQMTFNGLFVGTPIEVYHMGVTMILTRMNTMCYKGYAVLTAPTDEDFKDFEKLLQGTRPEPPGKILTPK